MVLLIMASEGEIGMKLDVIITVVSLQEASASKDFFGIVSFAMIVSVA
jgi:hypothetical protein